MSNALSSTANDFLHEMSHKFTQSNQIDPQASKGIDIKRGLRNHDGTGVMVGVTQIGNVYGYYMQNGERVPMPGKMVYRGINVEDLILGFTSEGRFGYEETAFLLLMGHLPTREELDGFNQVLDELPFYFNGAGFVNKHRTALFLLEESMRLLDISLDLPDVESARKLCEDWEKNTAQLYTAVLQALRVGSA